MLGSGLVHLAVGLIALYIGYIIISTITYYILYIAEWLQEIKDKEDTDD
mgnify:CR=1 FL=1|tara:strand:+ start:13 stop:159 length:147 start_codon:yes stop_codon:yes gene_type:complete